MLITFESKPNWKYLIKNYYWPSFLKTGYDSWNAVNWLLKSQIRFYKIAFKNDIFLNKICFKENFLNLINNFYEGNQMNAYDT